MPLIKIFIFSLICAFSPPSFAEDKISGTHPIDLWLESNLTNKSSDIAMGHVVFQAQQKWEAEINKVYKRLMKRLTPAQQTTLREAQNQWLKYRDAESKAILEIVSSQPGTIHYLSGADRDMELVRQRALDLISYEQEFDK